MKVIIRAAGWRYRLKDAEGKPSLFFTTVERGGEVDLSLMSDEDVARGREYGVWAEPVNPDDPTDTATTAGAPFDQGVGPLAEWLKANPLNVDHTVRLSEGLADRARLLLEAEPVATGGKPRKGVLTALAKVITDAEEQGTPEEDEEARKAAEAAAAASNATAGPDDGTAPADGGTTPAGTADGGTEPDGTTTTTPESAADDTTTTPAGEGTVTTTE